MRMRLAHNSAARVREKKRARQTNRMEHKFMFYDYFMIFMDRILCDRNLFIFFCFSSFRCSLLSCMLWMRLATVLASKWISQAIYYIDIMLTLALRCVAHVQEMWDRLCFYCAVREHCWPKIIDGIRLHKKHSVTCRWIIHFSCYSLVHLSLFTQTLTKVRRAENRFVCT